MTEPLLEQQINSLQDELIFAEQKEAYFSAISILETLIELQSTLPPELKHKNLCQWLLKHAQFCVRVGKTDRAIKSFAACEVYRKQLPFLDLNRGHLYKALGDSERAAECYNQLIADYPQYVGVGFWSLADLKDRKLQSSEVTQIQSLLKSPCTEGNQAMLNFALAKGLEATGEIPPAFAALTVANKIIAKHRPFPGNAYADLIRQQIQTFSRPVASGVHADGTKNRQCQSEAVRAVQQYDIAQETPIFIVGMPRSGSTLLEQILASHSLVDTTDELPFIERLAIDVQQLGGYPSAISRLSKTQLDLLRKTYIEQARQYTLNDTCVFIDKNPNNFMHIGLIKTLFPNAKVINVLRDPLDNALSVYKQYFSAGHHYSYDLDHIGFYWQGYLHLSQFWQKTYDRGVYVVSYAKLVESPEAEIRRLLEYCELPFEPECLTFYQSKRAVLTPSVSQVRQPINNRSIGSALKYQSCLTRQQIAMFNKLRQDAEALFSAYID